MPNGIELGGSLEAFSQAGQTFQRKQSMDLERQAVIDRKTDAILAPLRELRSKYYQLPAGPAGDADRQRIIKMFEQYSAGIAQPNMAKLFNASSIPNAEIAREMSSVYTFGEPEQREKFNTHINNMEAQAKITQAKQRGQAEAISKIESARTIESAVQTMPELKSYFKPETKGETTQFTPAQQNLTTIAAVQGINNILSDVLKVSGMAKTVQGKKLNDSYINKYAEINPEKFAMQTQVMDSILATLSDSDLKQKGLEDLQSKVAEVLRTGDFQGSPYYDTLQQLTRLKDPIGWKNTYKKFLKERE